MRSSSVSRRGHHASRRPGRHAPTSAARPGRPTAGTDVDTGAYEQVPGRRTAMIGVGLLITSGAVGTFIAAISLAAARSDEPANRALPEDPPSAAAPAAAVESPLPTMPSPPVTTASSPSAPVTTRVPVLPVAPTEVTAPRAPKVAPTTIDRCYSCDNQPYTGHGRGPDETDEPDETTAPSTPSGGPSPSSSATPTTSPTWSNLRFSPHSAPAPRSHPVSTTPSLQLITAVPH